MSETEDVVTSETMLDTFHLPLPSTVDSLSMDLEKFKIGEKERGQAAAGGSRLVVCQITYLDNSAFVWIGWGYSSSENVKKASFKQPVARFGPLAIGMPKLYGKQSAASLLIGSESDDHEGADLDNINTILSSRLSAKTGWAIFVSCSLENTSDLGIGAASEGIAHRAAGMAEAEISRRLLSRIEISKASNTN